MWPSLRATRSREADAKQAVLDAVGGRFALQMQVRSVLESAYGRRVSERDVRTTADGIVSVIFAEWRRDANAEPSPPPEFVRRSLEEWEESIRVSTTATLSESIAAGVFFTIWFGLLTSTALPWPYALLIGIAAGAVIALCWPRWKRRGRVGWDD